MSLRQAQLPVQALSGGNQQKVVIAKWIETEPKILILNSPTVGVDVGSKADIHAYARKLAGQGMGVIIISDDISEVFAELQQDIGYEQRPRYPCL